MKTAQRPPRPERAPTLLAIDPGLRDLGAAFFEGDRLAAATLVRNPNTSGRDVPAWTAIADRVKTRFPQADEVVLEMMVVRANRRDVNPDDLMQLVGIVGVLAGLYFPAPAQAVRPEHWKGRKKKRIHHPRIIAALDPNERRLLDRWMEERARAPYTSLDAYVEACRRCRRNEIPDDPVHNVLDAVGIGLWARGRK